MIELEQNPIRYHMRFRIFCDCEHTLLCDQPLVVIFSDSNGSYDAVDMDSDGYVEGYYYPGFDDRITVSTEWDDFVLIFDEYIQLPE